MLNIRNTFFLTSQFHKRRVYIRFKDVKSLSKWLSVGLSLLS